MHDGSYVSPCNQVYMHVQAININSDKYILIEEIQHLDSRAPIMTICTIYSN